MFKRGGIGGLGAEAPVRFNLQHGGSHHAGAESDYLEGKLSLAALELYPVSSGQAALTLFDHHAVDATPIPSPQFSTFHASPLFTAADTSTAFFLVLRPSLPLKVRLGIAHAINLSALGSADGEVDPLTSVVPAIVVPGYPPIQAPYSFQPGSASTALAGVRVLHVGYDPSTVPVRLSRWLRAQLRPYHVAVTPDRGATPAELVRISSDLPDPGSWLRALGEAVWRNLGGDVREKAGNCPAGERNQWPR